jgi:hypothetical protein
MEGPWGGGRATGGYGLVVLLHLDAEISINRDYLSLHYIITLELYNPVFESLVSIIKKLNMSRKTPRLEPLLTRSGSLSNSGMKYLSS